jgi:hypothetical protein
MPVNLNALIRYKTINSCLYGGVRKYDINELIGACSVALSESRGRYARISERTIRDDIRVMRSDILGFNAPIVQSGGLYFYSDPGYTILSVGINDPGILRMVVRSLIRLRNDIKHPELEKILEKLQALSPECFKNESMAESRIDRNEKLSTPDVKVKNIFPMFSMEEYLFETDPLQILLMDSQFLRQVSWGEVMKLV